MRYEDIKDFERRCEDHPDHQSGMISERMIQARLHEEIDELRAYIESKQEQGEPVALNRDGIRKLMNQSGYDNANPQEAAAFISGIRHREAETLYTAPPQQRKPLWINPNDKTQEQFLPNIGEPILFCHDGKTYYGQHNGGSFQCGYGVTKRYYNTWECRWMYFPAAHGITKETS